MFAAEPLQQRIKDNVLRAIKDLYRRTRQRSLRCSATYGQRIKERVKYNLIVNKGLATGEVIVQNEQFLHGSHLEDVTKTKALNDRFDSAL
jgi:hypothetical protein